MEIIKDLTNGSSASQTYDSRDMDSSLSTGPPPPPPLPPPPCQSLPSLNPMSCSPSAETTQNAVGTGKDEIASGIQKLLAWGMCSQEDDTTWVAINRHTEPILQRGPECGIVALCMAANMLEPQSFADKSQILETAMEKGYTIQGEMFSAQNMLDLASCACGVQGDVFTGSMVDNRDAVISHLASGWPVLVPYDKDGNCEPCCRRGHHAHWAVITGFLLRCKRQDLADLDPTVLQQDLIITNVYHFVDGASDGLPESRRQTVQTILERVPATDTYVLARQGKSKRICPWSYTALSDSNLDLLELGSTITNDIKTFVIPQGGIQAGLRSQFVLIRP